MPAFPKRNAPTMQSSWIDNLNLPTRRALLEMARRGLDVNAESFAVWYTYAAGRNPDLSNAIDQLDEEQKVVDQAACDELHARFFTYDR